MSSNAGLDWTAQAALTKQAALGYADTSVPPTLHRLILLLICCECCMQGQAMHHVYVASLLCSAHPLSLVSGMSATVQGYIVHLV